MLYQILMLIGDVKTSSFSSIILFHNYHTLEEDILIIQLWL